MHIIDRRLNPSGKSLPNRQRFLRRAQALVQEAVRDGSAKRDIREVEQGGEVMHPAARHPRALLPARPGRHAGPCAAGQQGVPRGRHASRARPAAAAPAARKAPRTASGEDEFRFVLRREEFLDLFLDDLELPDLAKRRLVDGAEGSVWHRAGYSVTGSPANLALPRTMRNSLSRRIALQRPKPAEVEALEEEIAALEDSRRRPERAGAAARSWSGAACARRRIPYIDPIDIRYRRFEPSPRPVAQAVMFCLMDVSGSMTEHMKDLAKRFYTLLYLFLQRRYKHVEIVFIRHTHEAAEVDEETFFHSRETGGTLVSTALEEMRRGRRRALPAGRVEHLRGAGLGRRQRRRRQPEDRAPAGRDDPAGLPVLRLYRSRDGGRAAASPASRAARATSGAPMRRW